MSLKLHNTLTRKKEEFIPLDPENIRMYVCGPTVYDQAHIGNARPVIVFDVLFRLLRQMYGEDHVTYVRNITDVDDKINARAAEVYPDMPLNDAIHKLTKGTTKQFHDDIATLGVLSPTNEPRATDHIDGMIEMTRELIEKGHAYEAQGHVLFDVASDKSYGCLSKRSTDEMMAGARVDVADYKKNPMDFVLWKPSSDELPGWDSPWGRGRPGWHLECSVMSDKYLGNGKHEPFDIHGGGLDLIFPHHENEIAQSTCTHGNKVMANYWLHNGYLQVEGEKMSKSLGNFITISDVLKDWPGEVARLTMLMTHYRKPIDWTLKGLQEAQKTLDHWYDLTSDVESGCILCADVLLALQDDMNTPKAIAALHELRREAAKGEKGAAGCLKASAQFLGLLNQDQEQWKSWRPASMEVDETAIENLINARLAAREAKDWAEADRIRDELVEQRIVLKDGKDPETGKFVTKWDVKR
jgi:cysteinyl-tRNA synthetase